MRSIYVLISILAIAFSFSAAAFGEEQQASKDQAKMEQLERMVQELNEQVRQMRIERESEKKSVQESVRENSEVITRLSGRLEQMEENEFANPESWINKFTLGGYGELHANFDEDSSDDQFDIHRLVLYLGYDFNDWIKFHSETEIEHAFVSSESGGELLIEQAYLDFLLTDPVNIRAGRFLTPLGIINKKHEPTSFYGVERPAFDKYIIPTTWSSDGVGVFGSITPSLKYEAYIVAGLDGSEFNAIEGIREGRLEERPSLNDVAFTGRLDYYPFAQREVPHGQWLRLGLSTYAGGLNNGNEGDDPGIDGNIAIYSGDFEYTISKFDFRGAVALEDIDGAKEIGNGTADQIFGWYLEGAYHFWPEKWKKGRLRNSDAVVFVRYDDFDTQFKMPAGIEENPNGDRSEVTLGMNFYLTSNLVVKADYQFRESKGDDPGNAVNFGIGWAF